MMIDKRKKKTLNFNIGGRTVGEDLLFEIPVEHFKKFRRLNSGKEKSQSHCKI